MYAYATILQAQIAYVRAAYSRQVTDAGHAACGAFLTEQRGWLPSADHGSHAADLARACYVFLAEGSELENDDELFHRIELSVAFQRSRQRPSGLVDLECANWESPPDTGFTVQMLAPIVEAARCKAESGNARAGTIAESLGTYVRTAAQGMIGRGFHTPNHRWVICSGLAQAMACATVHSAS